MCAMTCVSEGVEEAKRKALQAELEAKASKAEAEAKAKALQDKRCAEQFIANISRAYLNMRVADRGFS